MLEDLEEDTHLCIKCSLTIVGLENYVRHRKSNCSKRVISAANSLNRDIIDASHSYRSFEFAEPPSGKHDKQFNFNYEIEHHHHNHHDVTNATHILESPLHQSEEKVSDYKSDPNKSLSESYDYNYGLGADVFFSSLNLQSSSKTKSQNERTPNVNTSVDTADNLMKAVNAISDTKKVSFDSPQYSYDYKYTDTHDHGSPEMQHTTEYDDEEDDEIVEEDEQLNDDAPPSTHTGKFINFIQ